jgi:hypothetical protein
MGIMKVGDVNFIPVCNFTSQGAPGRTDQDGQIDKRCSLFVYLLFMPINDGSWGWRTLGMADLGIADPGGSEPLPL